MDYLTCVICVFISLLALHSVVLIQCELTTSYSKGLMPLNFQNGLANGLKISSRNFAGSYNFHALSLFLYLSFFHLNELSPKFHMHTSLYITSSKLAASIQNWKNHNCSLSSGMCTLHTASASYMLPVIYRTRAIAPLSWGCPAEAFPIYAEEIHHCIRNLYHR